MRLRLCALLGGRAGAGSSGSAKLNILLDAWAQCEGRWSTSSFTKQLKSRETNSSYGGRVWMTRSQIAAKFHSQTAADTICDQKLADEELKATHTKFLPDADGVEAGGFCVFQVSTVFFLGGGLLGIRIALQTFLFHMVRVWQELRLFYVWDAEGDTHTKDDTVEQLFEAVDNQSDSDSEGSENAKKKSKTTKDKDKKKKKKRSASSRSGSSSSASSSGPKAWCTLISFTVSVGFSGRTRRRRRRRRRRRAKRERVRRRLTSRRKSALRGRSKNSTRKRRGNVRRKIIKPSLQPGRPDRLV